MVIWLKPQHGAAANCTYIPDLLAEAKSKRVGLGNEINDFLLNIQSSIAKATGK